MINICQKPACLSHYLLTLVFCLSPVGKNSLLFARESKVQRKANALAVRKIMMAVPRMADAREMDQSADQSFDIIKEPRQLVLQKLSGASAKKFATFIDFFEREKRNPKIKASEYFEKTAQMEQFMIRMFDIESAPALTPQRALGEAVYQGRCAMCHGALGEADGPLAAKLKPSPISFTHGVLGKTLSAFRVYNTLITGIPNSPMKSFDDQLSEDELWSVAFWVMELTLPREPKGNPPCSEPKAMNLSLREISVARNLDLLSLSSECIRTVRAQLSYDPKRAR